MGVPLPAEVLTPNCELCRAPAHVLCPSDDAFLCRHCDGLVHSANFLVAGHHRTFLCCCCAHPTAIGASGSSLPAASLLCVHCQPITGVAELCCDSLSESSSCCSEVISDCDYDSDDRCCSIPVTGSSADNGNQPLLSSSMSDAISDVDEEELSSVEASHFSLRSFVQDIEAPALAQQSWRLLQRQR
ncbi:hypothetical protein L7F22_062598 [Adiantum nelumboides]|nr:hypothetical protein [Adiantum nelumboides]